MQSLEGQPVFSCRQCGECCQGERGILVTAAEVAAMAGHLDISADDFAVRYVIETALGPQLAAQDGACVMQEGALCRVHPVKPRICREWPFLPALLAHADEFEAAKEACPGIAPESEHEEFIKVLQG